MNTQTLRKEIKKIFSNLTTNNNDHFDFSEEQRKAMKQILSLFQQYEDELVEKIEKMKKKDTDPLHSYMPHVYNKAIDEVIALIKK